MNNKKISLIAIMLVAVCLRFYQLGVVPLSIDWDEAAIGYNAYSLLQTGKDEFGTPWPLVFRSFDDYKPPLYFYLTVPSVAVFGLTEFAVRFPSAFFGSLTVLFTYFLVEELLRNYARKKTIVTSYLPVVASFLLAISPWHIHFSRVAFEANAGVFFNVVGALTLIRGLRKESWWMVVSAVSYSLALYEYHSERVFVPLLLLCYAVLFFRELIQKKWHSTAAIGIGLIMLLPLILLLLNPSNLTRIAGTSSFSDQTGLLARNITKLEDARAQHDILGIIFANRRITYATVLLNGYLSHFNFNWLFITGDQERHKAPGMGLLYWWELPFLLVGLYKMAETSLVDRKMKWFVYIWFLVAPVAASITTEVPHAIRTLVFLPTFQIFGALGLLSIWEYFRQSKTVWTTRIVLSVFGFVFLFNTIYFLNLYFVHLNREYSKYWQYGYKEAVAYAHEHEANYDRIVVSTKLEQPHIFFLFFLKYSPQRYLENGGTYSGGFAEERNTFERYQFRKFNLQTEPLTGRTLYIGTPNEIPGDGIYHIDYLDGTRAIEFYET